MLETLKIIHFLSFSLAIGAAAANIVAGIRLAGLPPETGPIVGKFRMSLGMLATGGLVLLWLTGLTMFALYHQDSISFASAFGIKIAAVVVLTIISVMANMTISAAKKAGAPPDAQRMKRLGQAGLLFAVLALMFAVINFT